MTQAERDTYWALGCAAWLCAGSLLSALIAESSGVALVFFFAVVACLAARFVMRKGVQEPRRGIR